MAVRLTSGRWSSTAAEHGSSGARPRPRGPLALRFTHRCRQPDGAGGTVRRSPEGTWTMRRCCCTRSSTWAIERARGQRPAADCWRTCRARVVPRRRRVRSPGRAGDQPPACRSATRRCSARRSGIGPSDIFAARSRRPATLAAPGSWSSVGYPTGGLALTNVPVSLEMALGDAAAAELAIGPIPVAYLLGEPFNPVRARRGRRSARQARRGRALVDPYIGSSARQRRHWLAACMDLRCCAARRRAATSTRRSQPRRSVATLRTFALPIDLGRSLLVLGRVLRPQRRRAAKDAFDETLALFERCGMRPWHVRALKSCGACRSAAAHPTTSLRPGARVAELAARGRTNREIDDALPEREDRRGQPRPRRRQLGIRTP